MAFIHTIEGSWDEIRAREAELIGHHLRLTVLSQDDAGERGSYQVAVEQGRIDLSRIDWSKVDFNV